MTFRTIATVLVLAAVSACQPAPESVVLEVHQDHYVIQGRRGMDVESLLREAHLPSGTNVTVRVDTGIPVPMIDAAFDAINKLQLGTNGIEVTK
jgi:hypothetical protein